jgi:SAM-dependent methyltransferase
LTPAIAVIAAGVALLAAAWAAFGGVALQFSEYKAISHLLRMPGAKVLYENHSSLGMLQVVEAPGFHSAQGLSLRYGGELPAQIALVHDADSVSAVNAMTSPALSLAFFDAQLSALAFHASNDAPEVLVLGAGGGSAVQAALLFGAREIALVDSDPRVFAVLSGMFGNFTGLAGPHPGVRYVRDRSRRFLERAPADRFDLVIMSAAPPGGSGPGTHSLVEVPALTPAGFQAALRTLKPDGLLAVACPLRHPPREFVKLVATAIEAARTAGIASPSGHIAATNTWDLGMLLISRSPMSAARIGQIRAFCVERQFELAWLPGMDPDARGAHQGQDGQGYGEAFAALFRGEGKALMAGSPFDLEPASDARPYFFSSLSWRKLPALVRQMGWQWLPYADWGALVLAVSAVMLIGFAGVLIPLPLIAAPRVRREERPRLAVALYFLAIGIGYMALELAALQRGMMLLGDPVLATTLTVAAFLVASGMGSLASARVGVTPRAVMLPSLAVAVAAIPVAVVLTAAMPRLMTLSPSVAAIAFFGISASLACVMGFPFALGVRAIGNAPGATAWAWTFNGFASVATPPIATALMVGEGVVAVFVAAVAAYAIAAIAGLRLVRKPAAR